MADKTNASALSDLATVPLEKSAEYIRQYRMFHQQHLIDAAERLPVFAWIEKIPGAGALGLGQIIAEAGALSNYSNPAKLWKRMGLAVLDGEAQRRCRDKEKAERHGFNPRRRSIMYTVGDSLVKGNSKVIDGLFETLVAKDGTERKRKVRKPLEYRQLYLDRKELEAARMPAGTAKMHIHRRAQRYMEKRFLRNLWREWRRIAAERGK